MTNDPLIALIGATATVLAGAIGWTFSWLTQRDKKEMGRLQRRVARLRKEVRARIAMEKVAVEEIAELTGKPSLTVQREMRRRAVDRSGLRPTMSAGSSDLEDD